MDATVILVDNLKTAFSQLNTYFAIGLTSAVSAFTLEFQEQRERQQQNRPLPKQLSGRVPVGEKTAPVKMPAGIPDMPRETAKIVFLGVCFVGGALGGYAAESALAIVALLKTNPDVLKAACTYPSIATAPVAVRLIASLAPLGFVSWVAWRTCRRDFRGCDSNTLMGMVAPFLAVYGALAVLTLRLSCRL